MNKIRAGGFSGTAASSSVAERKTTTGKYRGGAELQERKVNLPGNDRLEKRNPVGEECGEAFHAYVRILVDLGVDRALEAKSTQQMHSGWCSGG